MARKQKDPQSSHPSSSLEPVQHLSSRTQRKLNKRTDKQQKHYRSSGKPYPLIMVHGPSRNMKQKPQWRLKRLLYGTCFGYRLYPVITVVSISAWMLTSIFDVIWLTAQSTFT